MKDLSDVSGAFRYALRTGKHLIVRDHRSVESRPECFRYDLAVRVRVDETSDNEAALRLAYPGNSFIEWVAVDELPDRFTVIDTYTEKKPVQRKPDPDDEFGYD